jgi:hypothetical protein
MPRSMSAYFNIEDIELDLAERYFTDGVTHDDSIIVANTLRPSVHIQE